MNLSGSPKTVIEAVDESILLTNLSQSILCVKGETARGKRGIPEFCGNSIDFVRKFGSEISGTRFPEYCIRMLDAGAKLWVLRDFHYTDIDDIDTVVGTKSTSTLTVATESVIFNAVEVGSGYDGIKVLITLAENGVATSVDITVQVPKKSDQVIKGVKNVLSVAEIVDLNKKLKDVQLLSITGFIPVGTLTLSGGIEDITLITDTDRNGTLLGTNGWYGFNSVNDAFRIANIHVASPTVDLGLAAYVTSRGGDMRFHVQTPSGSVADGMLDYRLGEGAYIHQPIDDYHGSMVVAEVNINDRKDSSLTYDIPAIVDTMPLYLLTDSNEKYGPWWSPAGGKRGKVKLPNNGVPYNLGSPANSVDFDRVYKKGMNAMIDDETFKTVYWGNKSLLLDSTKLLSKDNVADLVIYIQRSLRPLVRIEHFDPNDPIMWRKMYRNVLPLIQRLESGRAIRPGEGKKWFWTGDQNASVAEDAVFNEQGDLDNGIYKARFVFVPITATEFIGIDVVVTDSNSLKFIVSENI